MTDEMRKRMRGSRPREIHYGTSGNKDDTEAFVAAAEKAAKRNPQRAAPE